jgi:hypothetical protein
MTTEPFSGPDFREWRRRQALRLKQLGWKQRHIATALGASEAAVSAWLAVAAEGGPDALDYLPALRTLWSFACAVRGLFVKRTRVQILWQRRQAILDNAEYRTVVELVEAMALLEAGKFRKAGAFVYSPAAEQVRTNNHVERANRRFRFTEKLRYKWRRRKWVIRYVLLALDHSWRVAGEAAERPSQAARAEPSQRPSLSKAAG